MMQVEVVRRGGLAGVRLKGTFDTRDLPEAEAALRELAARHTSEAPTHPDGFQYEITPKGQEPLVLNEAELPATLRTLVEKALARAEIL